MTLSLLLQSGLILLRQSGSLFMNRGNDFESMRKRQIPSHSPKAKNRPKCTRVQSRYKSNLCEFSQTARGSMTNTANQTPEPKCIECGFSLLRVAYGRPSSVLANDTSVKLGGCLITEHSPSWFCPKCDEFR